MADSDRDRALAREIRRALMIVLIALSERYDLPPLVREDDRPAPRTNMQARMQSKAAMLDYAEERSKPPG